MLALFFPPLSNCLQLQLTIYMLFLSFIFFIYSGETSITSQQLHAPFYATTYILVHVTQLHRYFFFISSILLFLPSFLPPFFSPSHPQLGDTHWIYKIFRYWVYLIPNTKNTITQTFPIKIQNLKNHKQKKHE